ncbi:pentapeptide repeat-containing protein [Diaminobutyricimonas sp. TR449]|uniref:pentapeptide repeat-containing protein n=1 Tax=Diaminobutyricimonas sp. TR449 TaxID=2708076 RepID=UPI001420C791|nr:pentapeptide repeat-containing protein [Diaminobutyricimonas sp. TR449]
MTSQLLPGSSLAADCANCAALCCVALAFARSADFGHDKPAGDPCGNLADDFRCQIHPKLRDRGYKGCTVFDCFGAGQRVTQVTFGGVSWRDDPASRPVMFAVFQMVRQLHELLWYLREALELPSTRSLHGELTDAFERTERITLLGAEEIQQTDVAAHRAGIADLLGRASDRARAGIRPIGRVPKRVAPGGDLLGAKLAGVDLSGRSLRGAYLIAADLAGARLRMTDLIGADLRDANLSGADLSEALFLTQAQVNSARGDTRTQLPRRLTRPAHWTAG